MIDRGFRSRQSADCVNNSNNSTRRLSSARESSIWRTMTAVTKRTALQAIAVRVFLVTITLTMISFATRTTGKKRDLYLFAFLLPPLAELGVTLWKIVVQNSDQAG
ncbi:unnamed protein product [Dibothriocephalus latus]|uniref:Uncharacterized protein n=1 Tax=Dibothriocephalus latus TaxID=60516 RepID=A0A3P7PJA2_DIBLA|nr:unnamed protein product [Dibothriocephalus latus]